MEAIAHLDTHVVVWLYAGAVEKIPGVVRDRLETDELLISPAVVLELQYLFEIRRVTEPASAVVTDLEGRLGLRVSDTPFHDVVAVAVGLTWTRDPFDRLIVAQALAERAPLVTADSSIRKHFEAAVWSRAKRKS